MYVLRQWYGQRHSPDLSKILPMAVVMPLTLSLPSSDGGSDCGIIKLRLNVSNSSTWLSLVIGIWTVAIVVPAIKVAVILLAS